MRRMFVGFVCAGLLSAACGESSESIDSADFVSPTAALSDVTLSPIASSLTIAHAEVRFDRPSEVDATTVGDVCAAASDRALCTTDHDLLLDTDPAGWPSFDQCVMCESEPARLLVVTGPEGARIVAERDAAAVLAPIDHDVEVELVFGRRVRVQQVENGWRFAHSVIVETCDPVTERTTFYAMTTDGDISETGFSESSEDGVCI